MKTFLDDTNAAIEAAGMKPSDVDRVGTRYAEKNCNFEAFQQMAASLPSQEISCTIRKDLVILFHDFSWLERAEAEDPEGLGCTSVWIYRKTPRRTIIPGAGELLYLGAK